MKNRLIVSSSNQACLLSCII